MRLFLHSIFPIALNRPQYQGLALGILALPLAYAWVGLYPGYGLSAVQRIRGRFYATTTVFVVLLIWNYTLYEGQWSRGVLILTMFFALLLAPALESPLRRALVKGGICGVPVIILGAGRTGALSRRSCKRNTTLGSFWLACWMMILKSGEPRCTESKCWVLSPLRKPSPVEPK